MLFSKFTLIVVAISETTALSIEPLATSLILYHKDVLVTAFSLQSKILSVEESKIIQVLELMKILRTSLLSAKFQRHTSPRPVIRYMTRWSSKFEVLPRRIELREFVINVDYDEIDGFLLNADGEQRVNKLVKKLAEVEAVT